MGGSAPYHDRIADCFVGWKDDLFDSGRQENPGTIVLTSMVVYLAMHVNLPPWAIKEIEKI